MFVQLIQRQCSHHKYLFNKVIRCKHSIKCPFETLNLKPGCSSKEIRDSFAKLSKECHPDTSKSGQSDSVRFQNIVEAYRTINKYAHSNSQFIVNPNDEATCSRTENPYPLPKVRKNARNKLLWKIQYRFVEGYGYVPHYTINWIVVLFYGSITVFSVLGFRGIFRHYSQPADKFALNSMKTKTAVTDVTSNS